MGIDEEDAGVITNDIPTTIYSIYNAMDIIIPPSLVLRSSINLSLGIGTLCWSLSVSSATCACSGRIRYLVVTGMIPHHALRL